MDTETNGCKWFMNDRSKHCEPCVFQNVKRLSLWLYFWRLKFLMLVVPYKGRDRGLLYKWAKWLIDSLCRVLIEWMNWWINFKAPLSHLLLTQNWQACENNSIYRFFVTQAEVSCLYYCLKNTSLNLCWYAIKSLNYIIASSISHCSRMSSTFYFTKENDKKMEGSKK